MILFIDTDTSDTFKRHLPLDDPAQPWIVSLAADLCTMEGETRDFLSTRIRSEGRKIRAGAEAVHGVSSRSADKAGISEIPALGVLSGFAAQALYCVGHGIDFDLQVVSGVLIRRGKKPSLLSRPGLEFVDTMVAATPYCKIEPDPPRDDNAYKWPSLDEAGQILLQDPAPNGLHDAWSNCQRVKRLYFELKNLGAFEVAA